MALVADYRLCMISYGSLFWDWGFFPLFPGVFPAERVLWCTPLQLAGVFSAGNFKKGFFPADNFGKGFFPLKDSAEKNPSQFWKGFFPLIRILPPGKVFPAAAILRRGFFGCWAAECSVPSGLPGRLGGFSPGRAVADTQYSPAILGALYNVEF